MSRSVRYALVAGVGLCLALASSACISDPNGQAAAPMCEKSSDCDSGEVCEEGICYGNPPDGQLAAILVPSGESSRPSVQTAIANLEITSDGQLGELQLSEPIQIDGNVTLVCSQLTSELGLACGSESPIHATIRVERAPAFAGGPRFSQTFITNADSEGPSFSLALPPTLPDAGSGGALRNYKITVTPIAGEENVPGPAQIAPPRIETDFSATTSGQFVEWRLGEPDTTKWVSGCVVTGAGAVPSYAKGLPVAAFATDDETGESLLVSSRGQTDNVGCYSLRIPTELTSVNLRFEPDGSSGPAPLIQVVDEAVDGELLAAGACFGGSPTNSVCLPDLRGPNLTAAEEVTLPITAQASEGGSAPVAGATVKMLAVLSLPNDPIDPSRNNRVGASIELTTTSSANANPGQLGQATALAPVNLTYAVSVIPSADSRFAARIEEPRRITAGGVQESIHLTRRVPVSGQLLDASGKPIVGATVGAAPNLLFKFSQSSRVRAVLDSLGTSTTTREDGTYLFWLDGQLDLGQETLGAAIEYDISIVPPFLAGPPTELAPITPSLGLEMGEIRLPDASYARGVVLDHFGEVARDVELQIWQPTTEDPCAPFSIADGECPAAAHRIGTWLSSEDGHVSVVLPNPL